MAITFQVTLDCSDPNRLARFWASVLDYRLQDPPPGFETWQQWLADQGIPEEDWNSASAIVDPEGKGPRVFFQRVPEGKAVKNRMHLDVNVGGGRDVPLDRRREAVGSAVERTVGLGATKLREVEEHGEYHVVMQDLEENEFCLQ